jgi:hypothetical protein
MQKENAPTEPDGHKFDDALWSTVQNSKQVQGLAWKIEQAMQAADEARELVEMLVRKWAEMVNVRHYFPDLQDVFTPEAVFRIEYAHQKSRAGDRYSNQPPAQVRCVLTSITNLVTRHEINIGQLKHRYNSEVSRRGEIINVLPLFDIGEVKDGRKSAQQHRFIPPGAQQAEPKKPRRAATAKPQTAESLNEETERQKKDQTPPQKAESDSAQQSWHKQRINCNDKTTDEYAMLNFKFTEAGLTWGRLCVAQIKGHNYIGCYYRRGTRVYFAYKSAPNKRVAYHLSEVKVLAVVMRIERVVWEHGKRHQRQPGKSTTSRKSNQRKIARLRKQLEELKEEGEAHNESGVFRLERKIYDLEHKLSDNEWPDEIDG